MPSSNSTQDSPASQPCDVAFGSGLLGEFSHVRAAFEDTVVAKPGRDVFHRLALHANPDAPKPACGASSPSEGWLTADPETFRRSGLTPCQRCYRPILEYLAREPTSPVEAQSVSEAMPDASTPSERLSEPIEDLFEPVVPHSSRSLSALTRTVLVTSGSDVMHAPTVDGPLCEHSGDYRRVEAVAVESHYRPCKDCFDVTTSDQQE